MKIVIEDIFKCFLLLLLTSLGLALHEMIGYWVLVFIIPTLLIDFYLLKDSKYDSLLGVITFTILIFLSMHQLLYIVPLIANIYYFFWLRTHLKKKVTYLYVISNSLKFVSFIFYTIVSLILVYPNNILTITSLDERVILSLKIIDIMLLYAATYIGIYLYFKKFYSKFTEVIKIKNEIVKFNLTLISIILLIASLSFVG